MKGAMSGTEEQQQQQPVKKMTDFSDCTIDEKLKIYYCKCLEGSRIHAKKTLCLVKMAEGEICTGSALLAPA